MTVLPTDQPTVLCAVLPPVLPVGDGGIRRIAEIPGGAAAVGPFSQAVVANGFVFTAGQIPVISGLDHQPDTFEDQVRQTLRNLRSVLEAAGSSLEHVVKVNAYLTDPDRLEDYNRVYAEFFAAARPARTTVCVSLWGVSLEIDCVAVLAGAAAAGSVGGTAAGSVGGTAAGSVPGAAGPGAL